MKSFNVGIFVWKMWRDHIRRYPHTPEKAHQRRGEIASGRATDQARVIVKGEYTGQAMLAEKLGHHLEGASASNSPPTSPGNQIEVPRSTKFRISTTCRALPSGTTGTLIPIFQSNWN